MLNISTYNLIYATGTEKRASEIFNEELTKRIKNKKYLSSEISIAFITDKNSDRDSYSIDVSEDNITIKALGIRGFIYGIGMILRKTEFTEEGAFLIEDISGDYSPYMKIRGHQLGYRTTANSYEAWTTDEYMQYVRELMFFGCNTFEHTIHNDKPSMNRLMKYDSPLTFVKECCERAKELDIDI